MAQSYRLSISLTLLLVGAFGLFSNIRSGVADDAQPPAKAKSKEKAAPKVISQDKTDNSTADDKDKAQEKTADDSKKEGSPEAADFEAKKAKPLPSLGEANSGDGQKVVVIPIKGTIDLGLAPFVDRGLEEARNAALVVFDVDTFGGRVDAAVKIRDAILQTKVPTVAFVNRRAISAGALISLAADYIVFAPGGSMGAATPVQIEGGQAKAVGEKTVSYMRSEMRATAEAKGRDGRLAEAMVDADVALKTVIDKGKLLTVTTKEAISLGLASDEAADLRDLLDKVSLGKADVITHDINWAERVARFLTDPIVSGLLMSLGMLGIFLELYTPGLGFAGGLGMMCLMLFFGGHMVTNLAGWEELALFVLGLGALGIEVFIFPGFGIAGVIGLGLVGLSLSMAMVGMPISTGWSTGILQDAMASVVVSLVATCGMAVVAIRYLPDTRLGSWLVLDTTLGGTSNGELPGSDEAWEVSSNDKRHLLGARGRASTDLRPSGKAQLGDDVVDVVSRDAWIPKGTPVKVVQVEGIRTVVIEDVDPAGV